MAVANIRMIDLYFSCQSLSEMTPLPGRMSVLKGKRGEIIFDDTRLATPQSTEKMLKMLLKVPGKRKVLIQGPVLRSYQHGTIGDEIVGLMDRFDKVIFFLSNDWFSTKERGTQFEVIPNKETLVNWYDSNVIPGDLVVINASESIKMWEMVRELVVDEDL